MPYGAVNVNADGAELVRADGSVSVGDCPECCGGGGGGGPGPCDVLYRFDRCATAGGSDCPDAVQSVWFCCGALEQCMRAAGLYPLPPGSSCAGQGASTIGLPGTILYSGKCWQWAGVAKTQAELVPGDVLAGSAAFSCVRESDGQPFNGCGDPACPDSGGYVLGEPCACNPPEIVPAGPVYRCATLVNVCETLSIDVALQGGGFGTLCFTFRPGAGTPGDQLPPGAIIENGGTVETLGCCGCCARFGECTPFLFSHFAFCSGGGGGITQTPACCSQSGTKTITISGSWSNRLGDSGSGSLEVIVTFVDGVVVSELWSGSGSWTSGGVPGSVDFSNPSDPRPGMGVFSPGTGCISSAADRDVLFVLVAFIAVIGAPYTWNDPVNDCAAITESYSAGQQFGQATLRAVDSQGVFATMTATGLASFAGTGPCGGGCGGGGGSDQGPATGDQESGVSPGARSLVPGARSRGCAGCGGAAARGGSGGALI